MTQNFKMVAQLLKNFFASSEEFEITKKASPKKMLFNIVF